MADSNLMNGLLGKIYGIMTAPSTVPNAVERRVASSSPARFISFCAPGIAVDNLDFGDLSTTSQVNRCSGFSQMANAIPIVSSNWAPTGTKINEIYELALTQARLANQPLSSSEEKMLANAQKFLYSTVSVRDPFTEEVKEETRPSHAYQQYEKLYGAYSAAVRAYNNARITAASNPTPENIAQFTSNGPLFSDAADHAYSAWGSMGSRDNVERANGIIANLTARGQEALYDRMRSTLKLSRRADFLGNIFYPVLAYPQGILSPAFNDSWTKFTYTHTETHQFENASSSSWGGGASASFGLWSVGGGVSRTSAQTYARCNTNALQLAVDLIQVPINRPWLSPWIFSSRAWKGLGPLAEIGSISSGGNLPTGMMPLIPTAMILARNLKIEMDMTSAENRTHDSTTNVSASVGWGPFSVRGNYSSSYHEASHDYSSTNSGLQCPGAQIIAFVCEALPISPNPDPNLFPGDNPHLLAPHIQDPNRFLELAKWLS